MAEKIVMWYWWWLFFCAFVNNFTLVCISMFNFTFFLLLFLLLFLLFMLFFYFIFPICRFINIWRVHYYLISNWLYIIFELIHWWLLNESDRWYWSNILSFYVEGLSDCLPFLFEGIVFFKVLSNFFSYFGFECLVFFVELF